MITIRLYQKKNKVRADGKAPIFYVLGKNKDRRLISSKKYVDVNFFDNEKGVVTRGADSNSIRLNAYFKRQMTRLDDIIIDLENTNQEPTFDRIISKFLNDNSNGFISFALKALKDQKGLAPDTYRFYKDRLVNIKKVYGDFQFNEITHDFLVQMRNEMILRGRKINGLNHDFATIRKFYNLAVIKGDARGNPFREFKLGKEETVRAWLTREELVKLRSLLNGDKIKDSEKNTLIHFLFTCFCGIRFKDKVRFNADNLVDGRIQLKTSKTGKYVIIPFNDQAQELLPFVLGRKLK